MSRILKKSNLAIWSLCVATATLALLTSGSASAAEKIIKNSTGVDFDLSAWSAKEKEAEKIGEKFYSVKSRAGGSTKLEYGNAKNPYLHSLIFKYEEPKTNSKIFHQVWVESAGKSPTLDNTLNANSTLTFEALCKFEVSGSNGADVKATSKRIVNKSHVDIQLYLLSRGKKDSESIVIKKGETKVVSYGSVKEPYLDAIRLQWVDNTVKAIISVDRKVTGKGSWDDTLNTNNTLTITGLSSMKIKGSN